MDYALFLTTGKARAGNCGRVVTSTSNTLPDPESASITVSSPGAWK